MTATRARAKSTDTAGMIRMAQLVAANEGATQYLVPTYYGLDLSEQRPKHGRFLRVEPTGEVWKHSQFENGGPNGPEAPEQINPACPAA